MVQYESSSTRDIRFPAKFYVILKANKKNTEVLFFLLLRIRGKIALWNQTISVNDSRTIIQWSNLRGRGRWYEGPGARRRVYGFKMISKRFMFNYSAT